MVAKVKRKYACYLVDVRNDGNRNVSRSQLEWHRTTVKQDMSVDQLRKIGERVLKMHPTCDRITIFASGNKLGTKWMYDSAKKIVTDK